MDDASSFIKSHDEPIWHHQGPDIDKTTAYTCGVVRELLPSLGIPPFPNPEVFTMVQPEEPKNDLLTRVRGTIQQNFPDIEGGTIWNRNHWSMSTY